MIKEILIYNTMVLTTGREGTLKQYAADRFLRIVFLLGVLFNSTAWLWLAYQTNVFPDVMPLHYTIYYGVDSYGPWFYVFMMPIFGLVIFLVNVLISLVVLRRERLLSYVLVGAASFIQLVVLMATFAIVAINV